MENTINKFLNKILAKDKWLTIDKLWHLLSCMLITITLGCPIAGAVGFTKECADIRHSGFSYKDLVADAAGILIGLLIKNLA